MNEVPLYVVCYLWCFIWCLIVSLICGLLSQKTSGVVSGCLHCKKQVQELTPAPGWYKPSRHCHHLDPWEGVFKVLVGVFDIHVQGYLTR